MRTRGRFQDQIADRVHGREHSSSGAIVDRDSALDEYVATAQGAADVAVQYTVRMIEAGYDS